MKSLVAILACCLVQQLSAQGAAPATLTLEQALARIEAASPEVGIARAGVTSARADWLRARAAILPQLSGSATYTRTLASQFSVFSSSDSTTTDSIPAPTGCKNFHPDPSLPIAARIDSLERGLDCAVNASPLDFSKLPFGQKNTYNFGLAGSQSVFDPKNRGLIAAARAGQQAADIELTAQRAQAMLSVAQAYLDVLLADRLVQIADSTLVQSERTLAQTRLERQVGNAAEFDLLRATVARDNQRPVVIQRQAQRDQALLRLRQLLDLPGQVPLVLTTPLGDTATSLPPPLAPQFAAAGDTSIAGRAPVREAQASLHANEELLRSNRAARLPTLTLSSSYAKIAFPSRVFSFDRFLTDWSVSLRLDVPIYSGGRTTANVLAAEANRETATMRLRQATQQAQRDVQDVVLVLSAAQAVWEAVRGTVEQATRAYDIAELRYRNGLSTLTEVGEARLQLGQAEANRAQAARDFQVARIRATLLRDLPFGGQAAMPSASSGSTPGNP